MIKTGETKRRRSALYVGAAVAALSAGHVHAQTSSAAPTPTPTASEVAADNGEIVVTALKRATTAESTPLAITAVSGDTLKAMNITDSDSLQRISPGLVVRESNFSGSRLAIRNIRSAGEPTVGLYYDETPITGSAGVTADAGGTTPDIRLFDVERVEVLRGPQGTLYGSSSEAGTIRLIFNKPNTEKFSADIDAKGFGVDHGEGGYETQGAINIPLVADKLAIRAVGYYQDLPGYVDDVRYGQTDVNSSTSKGGRVTVRATPVQGLTIDGLAVIQDTHGHLNDYNLAVGPYKENYESQQPNSDYFEIYSGTINYDLGPVTLTAVGSHSYRSFDYAYDTSAFARYLAARYPVGSPPNKAFASQAPSVAESPQQTNTDTAEFRASTNQLGPVKLTAGFFYSDRYGSFASNIRRTSTVDGSVLPLNTTNLLGQRLITDELKQTAGFLEGTYDVTSRLSITGGVRYYHYRREVTGVVSVPNPYFSLTAGPATDQSSSESGWLYKGDISYKLASHVLAYATVSTGERPGGVNQTVGLPAALQTYGSDKVHNYEAGLKGEYLDRRLTLNADVFQIDWDNIQTSGTLPATPFVFIANASSARARGVEADATLAVSPRLTLQMSGSYIDAHLTANQTSPGIVAPGLDGDPIPAVPKVTLQPSAQYTAPLGSSFLMTLRADGYYQSSSWINFRHLNDIYERLPRYATLNLRAGITPLDGNWSVSVYASNITNSSTPVSKFGNTSPVFGNQPRAISLRPRTIGAEVTKHF